MRYFFMMQDTKLSNSIQYRDFDIKKGNHLFLTSDSERLNDVTVLYLAGDGKEARPDFIQHPVNMFSYRIKDILSAYEPTLIFKDVILIHKENSIQYNYVHTLIEQVDAVSEMTEYYPNQMPKRLVLDSRKIAHHNLFLPDGIQRKDPIASLPLVESLLRRKITGICFEEVEVD